MTKHLGGLGRGLGSLIPGADEQSGAAGVRDIPVDQIVPNPFQPRHSIDPEALESLAASIREHGLIQPLIVTASGRRFQIIAGERRWQAARKLGLATVPAIVKEATEQAMLEMALVENIQRADLNVLEEAAAYQQLHGEFGLTHEQIAQRVGRSRTAVTNTLRLLKLEAPVREAIAQSRVSANHGRALLPLTPEGQIAALDLIEREGLNARQTEALVRKLLEEGGGQPKKTPQTPAKDSGAQDLVEQFQQALKTKVDLMRSKNGGRLVIHFYSDEELSSLYEMFVHRAER